MQDTEVMEREGIAAVSPYERPAEAVFVEDGEEEEHLGWSEAYDVTVSPNDFNVSTLCNFLDKGVITIPRFQRDFVWTKRVASRFIQSIAMGLPVPELFLYEAQRNKWWVVDGQQRLLSIYLFRKGRFPRDKFGIGRLLREGVHSVTPDMWADNRLFSNFTLDLKLPDGREDILHGRSYEDLRDDDNYDIDTRPLRTIVVRQHNPNGYNAAYEIFNRLNTGGVRLSPQQIRECVYESPFLEMVEEINNSAEWRNLYGKDGKHDLKRVDAQAIVRSFAMLHEGKNYAPGMVRFLNDYCREMQKIPRGDERLDFMRELFEGFLRACAPPEEMFRPKGKFLLSLFEATFVASLGNCLREHRIPNGKINGEEVAGLAQHQDFSAAVQRSSATAANVEQRMALASKIISPL